MSDIERADSAQESRLYEDGNIEQRRLVLRRTINSPDFAFNPMASPYRWLIARISGTFVYTMGRE